MRKLFLVFPKGIVYTELILCSSCLVIGKCFCTVFLNPLGTGEIKSVVLAIILWQISRNTLHWHLFRQHVFRVLLVMQWNLAYTWIGGPCSTSCVRWDVYWWFCITRGSSPVIFHLFLLLSNDWEGLCQLFWYFWYTFLHRNA